MSILSTIGAQIRIRRRTQKLSQRQLGLLSGVSKNAIYNLEANNVIPTLNVLVKLTKALNCDIIIVDKENK